MCPGPENDFYNSRPVPDWQLKTSWDPAFQSLNKFYYPAESLEEALPRASKEEFSSAPYFDVTNIIKKLYFSRLLKDSEQDSATAPSTSLRPRAGHMYEPQLISVAVLLLGNAESQMSHSILNTVVVDVVSTQFYQKLQIYSWFGNVI